MHESFFDEGKAMSPDRKNKAIETRLRRFRTNSRLEEQSANTECEWPDLHEIFAAPPPPPPVERREFFNDLEADLARLRQQASESMQTAAGNL